MKGILMCQMTKKIDDIIGLHLLDASSSPPPVQLGQPDMSPDVAKSSQLRMTDVRYNWPRSCLFSGWAFKKLFSLSFVYRF